MDIQPSSRLIPPIVERQDLAPGPLGTVGNLRFDPQQGGTAPASEPGKFRKVVGAVKATISQERRTTQEAQTQDESQKLQMQRDFFKEIRDNSLHVGNLLGRLTVKTDTADAQGKVSRQLAEYCKWSEGRLTSLGGGAKALDVYMGELTFEDLEALRLGAVGDANIRAAVLNRIKDREVRDQANAVLKEVEEALKLRLVKDVVQRPLTETIEMLSAQAIDNAALEGQLSSLYRNLNRLNLRGEDNAPSAVHMLDIYLKSIPANDRASLLDIEWLRQLNVAEQALLQLYDDSRRQQALDMLHAFHRSLGRYIHARAKGVLTRSARALGLAAGKAEPAAVSKALLDLHDLVDTTKQSYGWLPIEIAEEVQELTKDNLDYFRHSSNPSGALNADSLRELDDFTLANLGRATRLHSLGLDLDQVAMTTIKMGRVEPFRRQLVDGMKNVYLILSRERVDELALMRQLRSLSDVEQQYTQQLADLGQFVSGAPNAAELQSTAYRTCEPIVADLEFDKQLSLMNTMKPYLERLKGWINAFDELAKQVKEISALDDYKDGASKIGMHLAASRRLLNGLGDVMSRLRSDFIRDSLAANADALRLYDDELAQKGIGFSSMTQLIASIPSSGFYTGLREQYGVAYDARSGAASVLVTDSVREKMAPELKAPPFAADRPTCRITLPVGKGSTHFEVSEAFHKWITEHRSISLSVRGTGERGRLVHYPRPVKDSPDEYPEAMGGALAALVKVAGSQEKARAHLMHYEHMLAAVVQGLERMDRDSPFKLEDGTVILFSTDDWALTLDVARTESGIFRNTMTVRFTGIRAATGLRPDNTSVPVVLDPETSWAEIQYCMHVSADDSQIKQVEVPEFRYHFDLLESQTRQAA